ncbi:MAG: hypothetical protein AAGE52_39405 [Myxococcota bacterium]
MRWALSMVVLAGCATGVPMDTRSELSARWARVLTEPLARESGHSVYVRYALLGPVPFEAATINAKRMREARWVLGSLLPLALAQADDEGLTDLGAELARAPLRSEAEIPRVHAALWREVDAHIASGLSAQAYQTVLYRTSARPPARNELAFVALEAVACWLDETFREPLKRSRGSSPSAETASLGPTSVAYLAVAAGAEPTEVRNAVIAFLEDLPRR